MDYTTRSCREFVTVLASSEPAPGGGGASALVAALGTALGNMVGSLTVGKKKYADVEAEIIALKEKCDKLQTELLDQVPADAEGFIPLSKAYGIPKDDPSRPVRVATKFVNIAKRYYASMGRDIDIIKLNGSIELAPILGLSDVIVDIVETGTTLRENGLKVVTEFMPISARFIANKASYQFKHRQMDTMLEKLRDTLHKQEEEK